MYSAKFSTQSIWTVLETKGNTNLLNSCETQYDYAVTEMNFVKFKYQKNSVNAGRRQQIELNLVITAGRVWTWVSFNLNDSDYTW